MKIDLKNTSIRISDGTATPLILEVKIGTGNCTFNEFQDRSYELDKGVLDTVRNADQRPVEVTLDFVWEWLKGDTAELPSVRDCLRKEGRASDWKSTDSDTCAPYAVDLRIIQNPECEDGTKLEIIDLYDFRWEQMSFDPQAGQVSVTGKCNVTAATITRAATT